MKFYDCSVAPSPRRVRMFIAEKGLDIETVEISIRDGEQMSPEFQAINPYCTLPVLELDDGTRLTNSVAIWHYLEAAHPEPALMGRTPLEKGLITNWQWRIEKDGMEAMGEALRNTAKPMAGRALAGPHAYEQIAELGERGKLRVQRFLDGVNDIIGSKPFVVGDSFSVADIELLVMIDFAKWLKLGLPEDAANAQRWYEATSARPSAQL